MARCTISTALMLALLVATGRASEAGSGSSVNASPMCVTDGETPLARVRTMDAAIADALQDGVRRSKTFMSLIERIEGSDGIVFIFPGGFRRMDRDIRLRAGMSHEVTRANQYRVIRVTVETGLGDNTLVLLAHELRHVLEVLDDPRATDLPSVTALYERIGFKVREGQYETMAAHQAEAQVRRELGRCKRQ